MAKKGKGNRVQVILECTEQKASGVPGMSRYITTKNKKNTPANKGFTKCIKMVKSEKTGAYVFKTDVIPTEEVKEFFNKK